LKEKILKEKRDELFQERKKKDKSQRKLKEGSAIRLYFKSN